MDIEKLERICRIGLFRDGLQSPDPAGGLRLRVQDLLNAGVTPHALVEDLQAFREVVTGGEEDIVLEIMDYLVGWCAPHARMAAQQPKEGRDGH